MELNYEFRRRLLNVHKKDMRDDGIWKKIDGAVVDGSWQIVFPGCGGRVLEYAAYDLMEYFSTSLGVYLRVYASEDIKSEIASPGKKIVLTTADYSPELAPSSDQLMAFTLRADADSIVICGRADRGAAQGCYYVEERMNINQGPVIELGSVDRAPRFSPRMIHSGYGLDFYPDAHIRSIAHAGMDAILVFVKDIDKTPHGYVDFNDLIYRAAGFGVDVYAYSYLISKKHPDDPDAVEHYESTYGRLFERCPGFKGVILVGESCEFPSKDPRVTPYSHREANKENNPLGLPSPGWFPCRDYPQWVNMVRDIIRAKKPDADFVFWTYNWGWVNEEDRLALIRNLPTDITLMATYEMFESFKLENDVNLRCTDYTLFFEGPGRYFASEAAEAKKRGIRFYTMSNTGGLTWDIGTVPYEPAPYQWKRRYDGLVKANEEWDLAGLMDSHHYGFWPSFVSELAKSSFWTPREDYDLAMREIAARDFGAENVDTVLDVWQKYSDGIRKYVSTNEDQYGPFRIGPSYPLLFLDEAELQSVDYAHFGNNTICHPMYHYDLNKLPSLMYEIDSIGEMRRLYAEGNAELKRVADSLSGRRKVEAEHLLALGRFMENAAHTVVNVKNWYLLKCDLLAGKGDADEIKAKMRAIAQDEIQNARDTIPLVEYDSRLGYEPSMEYMCDREHLEWKIVNTEKALEAVEAYTADASQSAPGSGSHYFESPK